MDKKLVIDRGALLTGRALKYVGDSSLRHSGTGLMCCLGQYCKTEGYTEGDITDVSYPSRLNPAIQPLPESMRWLFKDPAAVDMKNDKDIEVTGGPKVQHLIGSTNDDPKLHPTRREARIKKLFKKYGDIDVEFTGRYADATKKARRARAK